MEAEYIAYSYDGITVSGYHYIEGDKQMSFGATTTCYPTKEGKPEELYRLSGTEAKKEHWNTEFLRLGDDRRRLVLAVFPNIKKLDNLKPPKTIYEIAVSKIHKVGLTRVCSRCDGTGHYSYNQIDGTRCFKCGGRKFTLPKITDKYLALVKKTIAAGRESEDAL